MMLDLPLTRPVRAPFGAPAWLTRLQDGRRARTARREAAGRLARRDLATGLVEQRVATLWLHAAAGMAARRGERLAIAIVKAPGVAPQAVAKAIAQALPVGGMGARWTGDAFLVAAPGKEGVATWLALRAALDEAGLDAQIGWTTGTDPDAMLETLAA